ncbi:hypothetical protein SRHO_G00287090 [Serrasalmus rhombeus]
MRASEASRLAKSGRKAIRDTARFTGQRDLTVWRATLCGVSLTLNRSTKPSLCCRSPSQDPAKALLSGGTVWRFEDCLNQTVGLLLTVNQTTKARVDEATFQENTIKIRNAFPGTGTPETNLDSWTVPRASIFIA